MANKRLEEAQAGFSMEKVGFLIAGVVVAVFVGDALFPSLAGGIDSRLYAGLKGGVGAIVGLLAHQIYQRARGT